MFENGNFSAKNSLIKFAFKTITPQAQEFLTFDPKLKACQLGNLSYR